MKILKKVFLGIGLLSIAILFSQCKSKDEIAPKIYFTQNQDTTVLLFTPFTDPGVYVEDNKDLAENIKVESNFNDVLSFNNKGEVRRGGDFEITYKATDMAGNTTEAIRTVHVLNVSEPLAGIYNVQGDYNNIPDKNFNSSISASKRYAGAIRFAKSYVFKDANDKLTYLTGIEGFLLSETYSLDYTTHELGNPNENPYAWMTTPENPNEPFFAGMTYEVASSYINRYDYIDIPRKQYKDSLGNVGYYVQGMLDNTTQYPKSKITYDAEGAIVKIELHMNVTKVGSSTPDIIKETYTPK